MGKSMKRISAFCFCGVLLCAGLPVGHSWLIGGRPARAASSNAQSAGNQNGQKNDGNSQGNEDQDNNDKDDGQENGKQKGGNGGGGKKSGVPEIDAGSAGTAFTLLVGGVLLLTDSRKRRGM